MARAKTRFSRSFPIWPGMPVGAPDADGVTVDADAYSNPVRVGRNGNAAL